MMRLPPPPEEPTPVVERGLELRFQAGFGARASGGANSGSDLHLHFHGPSAAPSVERWFAGLLARNRLRPAIERLALRNGVQVIWVNQPTRAVR